jgi:hypothetical protein
MAQPISAGDRAPSRRAASGEPPRRESLAALLWRELCAAGGSLRHSPSFTWPAFLSVALGTGAALALFGVFSALTLECRGGSAVACGLAHLLSCQRAGTAPDERRQ